MRSKLICFGDSITQQGWSNWMALLASHYEAKLDVVNRGYSGYNVEWASRNELIDDVLGDDEKSDVTCVLVCFGANDSCVPESAGTFVDTQHVPLDRFKSLLASIVDKLLARLTQRKHPSSSSSSSSSSSRRIVLVTPPTVDDDMWAARCNDGTRSRSNERAGLYAQAVRDVAEAKQCGLCDVYAAFERSNDSLLSDGLHLNERGGQLFFDTMLGSQALPVVDELAHVDWKVHANNKYRNK
jgi:isoamyl acetate esterase